MRPSSFIVVALLLAGCSEFWDNGAAFDNFKPQPESYWVVTRTLEGASMPGGEPRCASETNTDATRLTFTAPATVTLTTLRHDYGLRGGFSRTGSVNGDGFLTFSDSADAYSGRFISTDRFSLSGRFSGACPFHLIAERYEGPRYCEVTTVEEELELASAVSKAVEASHLGELREFYETNKDALFGYDIPITDTGTYLQNGATWTFVAPDPAAFHFVFQDGAALTYAADAPTTVTVTHPDGWLAVVVWTDEMLRVTVDNAWIITYEITLAYAAMAGKASMISESPMPMYRLRSYETPIGTLRWTDVGHELAYAIGGREIAIVNAEAMSTLKNGTATKSWTAADRDAYCPSPGRALIQSFPNLLTEMGICETTPLTDLNVECLFDSTLN